MGHNTMNNESGIGGVYGTIITVVLLFITKFTLSDFAAVAAIFAGVSTGMYNVYRFFKDRKVSKSEKTKL